MPLNLSHPQQTQISIWPGSALTETESFWKVNPLIPGRWVCIALTRRAALPGCYLIREDLYCFRVLTKPPISACLGGRQRKRASWSSLHLTRSAVQERKCYAFRLRMAATPTLDSIIGGNSLPMARRLES